MSDKLSPDEIKNGWTDETLEAYALERATASGHLVAGNVVTEFKRPRAAIQIENTRSFTPHKW